MTIIERIVGLDIFWWFVIFASFMVIICSIGIYCLWVEINKWITNKIKDEIKKE